MLDEDRDTNPYLQQEVLTASPVRLRWMLISRAKDLCEGVESLWSKGENALGDQWLLRVRDILGELLAGVTISNPASSQVSDLYLFLLKTLSESERSRDLHQLGKLRELLAYEADTWQLLMDKNKSEANESLTTLTTPLHTHLPAPISANYSDSDDFSPGSSFSLDM